MYDELVKALRGCVLSKPCAGCPYYDPNGPTKECATMNIAAADAIEELMRFAHFVAREVMVSDEEWELNNLAFPEIICRKLNNLGVVSKVGEMWHYEPSKEES